MKRIEALDVIKIIYPTFSEEINLERIKIESENRKKDIVKI